MSRLTNKNHIFYQGRMSGKTIFKKIYDKLYTLEDLEEELGCPLDVVFRALKTQIIYDKYARYLNICILKKDEKGQWLLSNTIYVFYLKDYGKTWWLKDE